jgi:hypothetical protein
VEIVGSNPIGVAFYFCSGISEPGFIQSRYCQLPDFKSN